MPIRLLPHILYRPGRKRLGVVYFGRRWILFLPVVNAPVNVAPPREHLYLRFFSLPLGATKYCNKKSSAPGTDTHLLHMPDIDTIGAELFDHCSPNAIEAIT